MNVEPNVHDRPRAGEVRAMSIIPGEIHSIQAHLKDVLEGDAFKGSPRSGQFLKYIVDQTISGHSDSLKERVIGMEIFGRAPSYDTSEDAIVRVTASDVRKRLLQHYGRLTTPSEYRISLPTGSYVPRIEHESRVREPEPTSLRVPHPEIGMPVYPKIEALAQAELQTRKRYYLLSAILLFLILNLGVWVILWHTRTRLGERAVAVQPWQTLFGSQRATELITSDPNIAEIQGFTGGQISLSDYANRKYIPSPNKLTPEELHFCLVVLRGDKASTVDTPIAVNIAQLAQAAGKSLLVRGARSIQLSDLQTDKNLVLLGSPRSNPWVGLFNEHLDFKFEFDPDSGKEFIRNVHPQRGEAATYLATAPGWATGETYAVVAFIKNPDQNGDVLLLSGENGEGTEAAGKLVNDVPRLAQTLKGCGSVGPSQPRYFEILLHLHTIAGSSSNVDTVACHAL